MGFNYYFDIASIIAFLIMVCMVLSTRHIFDSSFKILCALTAAAFFVPITDLVRAYAIDNRMASGLVIFLNILYMLVHMLVTFFFLMYVISRIEMSKTRSLIRKICIYTPLALCIVLILITPIFKMIFSYSVEEGYVNGPLYFLVYQVPIGYFIWTIIYTIKNRNYLDKNFRIMITIVSVVNLSAIVAQIFFPNFLIRGFMLSMSAIVMFFYSEHTRVVVEEDTLLVGKDYLISEGDKMLRNNYPFSLILVKIANFDALSDTFGHANANALGQKIASYIGHKYRFGTCFRIGESTMAILNTDTDKTNRIKEDLYSNLSDSWDIEGLDISCDILLTSIDCPKDAEDTESVTSIVRHFNRMERSAGGIISVEELHINEHIRQKQVENAIDRGLRNNSFRVFYQPIHSLEEDVFVTAEALVRLTDPDLGPISPAEFIPIAENNGTIVAIGDFVLDTVCQFIEDNDMEQLGLKYIELNLSVIQCLQKDFIENVESIVKKHNIDPKYLCLEVTETASNYSPTVFKENLEMLGNMGYALALDDFGTGYANIERMVTSDFRIVKFDKEMTQYSSSEERLQNVFEKLQNVVHSMDSKVVAEGVETKEQYEYLKKIGCDYIKGYYFSKPVPQEEFVNFIKSNNVSSL